jgi:acyl-CoA thioesterase
MNRFQRDTAVTPLGDGRFAAHVDPGWRIVRGPNGGYVTALLLRALQEAIADPARTPRSLTVHFTSPPSDGPCEIRTAIERTGRSMTTVSGRFEQDGKLRAIALAAFGTPRTGPELHDARMPEVVPPERATPLPHPTGMVIPMRERYESRAALGAFGARSAEAVSGGWIRLREEPHGAEPPLVAAYTDAWPPAIFTRIDPTGLAGGVPTIDLTVHFRSPWPAHLDPADFALVVFRTRFAHAGFLEEDGEVWTRDGVLLAQSRQLALIG